MSEPHGRRRMVEERSRCTTYELFRQLARRGRRCRKRNDMLRRIDFGYEDNGRDDYLS